MVAGHVDRGQQPASGAGEPQRGADFDQVAVGSVRS
ncbi:hypothetical protein O980_09860 [Mycobacterium avium subsp. paratuberculosis 08-8281]|nr:hypothetical protein O980_09860 [Mycobacterium avium subsp. paratuberculosis 08-8281]